MDDHLFAERRLMTLANDSHYGHPILKSELSLSADVSLSAT